jgi:hypothetical protein
MAVIQQYFTQELRRGGRADVGRSFLKTRILLSPDLLAS